MHVTLQINGKLFLLNGLALTIETDGSSVQTDYNLFITGGHALPFKRF